MSEMRWGPEPDNIPDYPRPLCLGASLKDDFIICCPKNMTRQGVLSHCIEQGHVDMEAGVMIRSEACEYGNYWLVVR